MTMDKMKKCRLIGYKEVDTALPQGWFNMILAELKEAGAENPHPWAHFVWVYKDKHGSTGCWGVPGPITRFGRDLLKALDIRDGRLEPVSRSLSGMHE